LAPPLLHVTVAGLEDEASIRLQRNFVFDANVHAFSAVLTLRKSSHVPKHVTTSLAVPNSLEHTNEADVSGDAFR